MALQYLALEVQSSAANRLQIATLAVLSTDEAVLVEEASAAVEIVAEAVVARLAVVEAVVLAESAEARVVVAAAIASAARRAALAGFGVVSAMRVAGVAFVAQLGAPQFAVSFPDQRFQQHQQGLRVPATAVAIADQLQLARALSPAPKKRFWYLGREYPLRLARRSAV